MLMTRMTPKVMARPRAARIKMEPRLRLLESAAPKSLTFIGTCGPVGRGDGDPRGRVCKRPQPARLDRALARSAGRYSKIDNQLPSTCTSLPLVTPPLVQSQPQPGNTTCG